MKATTRPAFTHLLAALLLSLAALSVSCAGDDVPDDGGTEQPDPDNPDPDNPDSTLGDCGGTTGCLCSADLPCGDGFACSGGACIPACSLGGEGCGCGRDNACGVDDLGVQLACTEGTCEQVACTEGTLGCGCDDGGCSGELTCSDVTGVERCEIDGCTPGTEDCGCNLDRTCVGGGLACADGLCEELTDGCRLGQGGCPCEADFSCQAGLACADDGICDPISCTPGSVGCPCDSADACDGLDAFCDPAGRCQRLDCPEGDIGCACHVDDTCGTNSNGEQLVCTGGVCASPFCTLGEPGCACVGGSECSDGVCTDGFCLEDGCTPGGLACSCAGGSCNGAAVCVEDSVCVSNDGFAGGQCLGGDACRRGNRCRNDQCVPCMLGSLGCGCQDDGGCGNGTACLDGVCLNPTGNGTGVPANPVCYTPCSDSFTDAEGEFHGCSSDGLMEGCFGDTTCTEGQCLNDPENVMNCVDSSHCPDFQDCVAGRCMSNCLQDGDCITGAICSRAACRMTCDSPSACAAGIESCVPDGLTGDGLCMPLADVTDPVRTGDGFEIFGVDPDVLRLTRGEVSGAFVISNRSNLPITVRIRKAEQRLYDEDGRISRLIGPQIVAGTDSGQPCYNTAGGDALFVPGSLSSSSYDDDDQFREACPRVDVDCGCAMNWLSITAFTGDDKAEVGSTEAGNLEVVIPNGSEVLVELAGADGRDASRWEGILELSTDAGQVQTVQLSHTGAADGTWSGTMQYFGNFDTTGMDQWMADSFRTSAIYPSNALLRSWSSFRRGGLSLDAFEAVLQALERETWRTQSMADACGESAACAPFVHDPGYVTISTDRNTRPLPSGTVDFPISMNLRQGTAAGRCDGAANCFEGRINTGQSLHYPGNPAVSIQFNADPTACELESPSGCITTIADFEATTILGGRTELGDGCAPGFQLHRQPWLVEGFVGRATSTVDGFFLQECRASAGPFADDTERSMSIAGANPALDGQARVRTLELIDGAVLNNSTMFILFKETTDLFLENDSVDQVTAYGYMVLEQSPVPPSEEAEAYNGNEVTAELVEDAGSEAALRPGLSCSDDLLETIFSSPGDQSVPYNRDLWTEATVERLIRAIVDGVTTSPDQLEVLFDRGGYRIGGEYVHYLCEDTGGFDGIRLVGSDPSSAPAYSDRCPEESRVRFFTSAQRDIRLDCMLSTSSIDCGDYMTGDHGIGWRQDTLVRMDPYWQCADDDEVYCMGDRDDLRQDKVFYQEIPETELFLPLRAELEEAFAYRLQFESRSGASVGFVPEACVPNSSTVPFCYDPVRIEGLADRMECALELWTNFASATGQRFDSQGQIASQSRDQLLDALSFHLGSAEYITPLSNKALEDMTPGERTARQLCPRCTANERITRFGFEHLYAELLILFGDENYTASLASRFDLAETRQSSFQGEYFEPNGINLSGVAGAEMVSLYSAAQYYDMVLRRFFTLSPNMVATIRDGQDQADASAVQQSTVTSYLRRVMRASTQKARTWSEVAERYQNFNRPDLARRVIERAYINTYLESIAFNEFLRQIVDAVEVQDRAQIETQINETQLAYRVAMNKMRQSYQTITDEMNYFGFPIDYVPFPANEYRSDNGFETAMFRARARTDQASLAEDRAIESNRSFNTDAANFQSELARIRSNYDAQLADLCGTFEGDGGGIYPAINRYAHLSSHVSAVAATLGDPCGLVGNGQIHDGLGAIESIGIDAQRVRQQITNTIHEAAIEEQRWNQSCNVTNAFADAEFALNGQINSVQAAVSEIDWAVSNLDQALMMNSTFATLTKCSVIAGVASGGDCMTAAGAVASFSGWYAGYVIGRAALTGSSMTLQVYARELEASMAHMRTVYQCDLVAVDGRARVATILLRLTELDIEARRVVVEVQQAGSRVEQMTNQAQRIQDEREEMEQLLINVEAARNDPNIRIYRNDAILNADITFYSALREAYKATRVLEYYTSSSYPDFLDLFLIRMVSRGEYNLQNYLIGLEDYFRDFEDEFGQADQRLMILSMMDDVMQIPTIDEHGQPYRHDEREKMFRDRLLGGGMLDDNGWLVAPFSIGPDRLSPITGNHKINYVAADIRGSGLGDALLRVYLRMSGTSTIQQLHGDLFYYTFPQRTAVINAANNGGFAAGGEVLFNTDIARNRRLADRPVMNSRWELMLNLVDEEVNEDIDLAAIDDIKLYIYYSDFTEF